MAPLKSVVEILFRKTGASPDRLRVLCFSMSQTLRSQAGLGRKLSRVLESRLDDVIGSLG